MAATPTLFSLLDSLNFDVKSGVALSGGDPDIYCALIRELNDDILPLDANLVHANDLQKLQDYAHMLKGTLATLGENAASRTALELERSLREGRLDAALARRLLPKAVSARSTFGNNPANDDGASPDFVLFGEYSTCLRASLLLAQLGKTPRVIRSQRRPRTFCGPLRRR